MSPLGDGLTGNENLEGSDSHGDGAKDVDPAPAYAKMLSALDSFLAGIESLGEMTDLVLPELKRKDRDRASRITELAEQSADGEGGLVVRRYSDLREVMRHVKQLTRAERAFRQGVIVNAVASFDGLIRSVLIEAYARNLGWLRDPKKTVSYVALMEAESLEQVRGRLVDREVDQLMRGSRNAQLRFLDKKLKLGVEREFDRFPQFVELAERRNLIIHTGGQVSQSYFENCAKVGALPDGVAVGDWLKVDLAYIEASLDCLFELGVRVAHAAVRRIYPSCLERAGQDLNAVVFDQLTLGRYEAAQRIADFAVSIPDKYSIRGGTRLRLLVNRAIAIKGLGGDCLGSVREVEWSTLHPVYQLAVAALRDEWGAVTELLGLQSVRREIDEDEVLDWPLFRWYREWDGFADAYQSIYGKVLKEELRGRAAAAMKESEGA